MKKTKAEKEADLMLLKELGSNGYKEAAKKNRVSSGCKTCTIVFKSKKDYSRKEKHKEKYSENY